MAELPRLNGIIRALEAGQPAFTCFSPAEIDSAYAMSVSKYDGVVYEMEHNPWDGRALRDCLQYMLNRAQIAKSGSLAAAVTPLARVPVNGVEMAQWQAKQALDMGCYGIVFPHISTVEEAANAVGQRERDVVPSESCCLLIFAGGILAENEYTIREDLGPTMQGDEGHQATLRR